MTYSVGGLITADDYNSFSTLSGGMNQIFADMAPGSVPTVPGVFNPTDPCTYGYGQTPALTPVAATELITTIEWSALFDSMRRCGTHQGTNVVPPLPSTNPPIAAPIASYVGLTTLLTNLSNDRFHIASGQGVLTPDNCSQPLSTPWTNILRFTCSVQFSDWDHLRYFFNAGGYLSIAGTYAPVVTPDDASWNNAMIAMGTQKLLHNYSTGSNVAPGFYQLTTAPQEIYLGHAGGGHHYYYSGNTITINAKLNAAPGLATSILFTIALVDNDPQHHKPVKHGTTTYTIGNLCAAGPYISIPAPHISSATFTSI